MVKTPKMRHSKSPREPLTIDLEAASTARDDADAVTETPAGPDETDGAPEQPVGSREEADEYTAARSEAAPDRRETDPVDQPASPSSPFETAAPAAGRAASAPVPSGRGGFSSILAGAIGAAIALLVAYGLFSAGVFGGAGSTQPDTALQEQIDVLKQQVSALQSAPQSDVAGRLEALTGEVETVKGEIAALKSASSAAPAGNAAPAGADPAVTQALDDRLKAVETALAGLAQAGGGQTPADISALGGKIATLEAGTKAATDSAAASAAKIAALEQAVAALTAKIDAQASQPQVALAIASAALRSALDRGGPFTAELDTLGTLSSDAASVAALRPYAEQGVATLSALKSEADAAASAMIAAANPPDENAGFMSRLMHSAGSLVTVRPIGAVDGADAGAVLGRMEAAIDEGRLDAAVAEFDSLPPASQAAGASFGERLKARQAADQLVAKAIAGATKA